jgi:ABC-type nitrate/sulfonate/bicarbonate transport system substrate-binding protein
MSRSRVIFFLIIGAALVFVFGAIALQNSQRDSDIRQATVAAQATMTAVAIPGNNNVAVVPIFAGGQPPTDNLPKYVCAADAFGSYYALQQMQVAGYDVKFGFHLGIIPIALEESYNLSEEARTSLLQSGTIDCLFTTLDSAALTGAGVITAVVDESAGADQLWARSTIKTINDLRGKKLIYASGSVGEFFALYTLNVAGLVPRNDVQMVPADSVEDAVKRFNQGQADAVSGWEPDIRNAAQGGGQYLIGSDKLRVVVDVIMTSRNAISTKAGAVQGFHNAWFFTLKNQFENFPTAAKQIADWGNNDWTGIQPATAEADLGKAVANIAQAGLSQNSAVMSDPTVLVERLDTAQRVWAAFGRSGFTGRTVDLVDPQFIRQSATRPDLATSGAPKNATFLLTSRPNLQAISPNQGETLAILPCRKFGFVPESTQLTSESKRILDNCVLPTLSSSTGIYLRVVGSAAWPKNDPPWTEKDIRDFARARAQSVADYLAQKGIDPKRLTLDAVIPPEARRNIESGLEQEKDRFVEMTLITVGR